MNRPADGQHKPFQGLPSAFRLKKKGLIRALFDRGRRDVGTIARGSIRLLYRIVDREEAGVDVPIQVGFAAPRGGTAVGRNRTKRVLREVYRVHQQDLIDLFSDTPDALTLMVIFRGRAQDADAEIRRDLPATLRDLVDRLNESSTGADR